MPWAGSQVFVQLPPVAADRGARMIDLNQVGRHYPPVDERHRIESALSVIDPQDREAWVAVGQAIQNELGEDGFSLWNEWSQGADNYNERAALDVWRSFGQGGGRTVATLFKLARDNGWADDTKPAPLTQEEAEARRRSREEAKRLNAETKAKRHAERALVARAIYEAASPEGVTEHAYAARKGVINARRVRRGRYLDHDCLIVPLYGEDGQIQTVQAIAGGPVFDGNRDKTLLGGARKSGCFLLIGPTFRGASRICIAEGLATAEAVHNATGLPVVMAVDAGNMLSVGEIVRRLAAPGAEIVFCADDDQNPGTDQNTGMKAAQKAAQAVGGVVASPAMGKKADFWDVWAELGPEAVRERIGAALASVESDKSTQGKTTNPPRLRALRRNDLMATEDVEWIIKGVMPSRGLGAVYGPSTVGKSFLMVDQAAAIAEGREWFGCRVKKRPVVYACLEGQHGFKRRVAAWESHHGRRYPDAVIFTPDPIDLRTEQDTAALIALVQAEAGPGAVVIIDTLNRAAPGMEENGSVDYGLILANAGKIEQAVGGFVCFVGHPGKDAAKGLRGHSSMFAGLDMVLEVEEVNRTELSFAWITRKVKDGQDGIKRHFRREVIELGQDADGDPVTSCVVVPDPDADQEARDAKPKTANISRTNRERFEGFRQAAMEYGTLDDAGQFVGLEKDGWRNHFYLNSQSDSQDAKRMAFGRAAKDLEKIGLIYERADGLFQFDGPGAEAHAEVITAAITERTRGKATGRGEQSEQNRTNPNNVRTRTDRIPNEPNTPSLEGVRCSVDSGENSRGDENQTEEILKPSSPGTLNPTGTDGEGWEDI